MTTAATPLPIVLVIDLHSLMKRSMPTRRESDSNGMDGTSIYITMGAVFLAQATNTPLDIWAQLQLLLVAMLTSKGASGITGAGFVTLAATMQAVPSIPLESLSLLVGIDRFMSECRSITNTIGNGVAAVVISRWEGEVTIEQINQNLTNKSENQES